MPDYWPLVVLPDTKAQFGVVASVLRAPSIERVVCATDAGREVQVDMLGNASAFFPLRNPGIVTIPLAFAVAIIVSLLRPVPEEAHRFAQAERRLHLGSE